MEEYIGLIASVCLIFSMLVKSATLKGNFVMRAINLLGCILFVIYGILLHAWSTSICNGLIGIINIYYIIRLIIEIKHKVTKE